MSDIEYKLREAVLEYRRQGGFGFSKCHRTEMVRSQLTNPDWKESIEAVRGLVEASGLKIAVTFCDKPRDERFVIVLEKA